MSYSQQLEDRIDHYLIDNEDLVKNKEMGWVGYLLNGHMCFGIYDDLLIVRIAPENLEMALSKEGISMFEQADKTAGEIIAVKPKIHKDPNILHGFIDHSMKYVSELKPR